MQGVLGQGYPLDRGCTSPSVSGMAVCGVGEENPKACLMLRPGNHHPLPSRFLPLASTSSETKVQKSKKGLLEPCRVALRARF
jgi:hypothetical protein